MNKRDEAEEIDDDERLVLNDVKVRVKKGDKGELIIEGLDKKIVKELIRIFKVGGCFSVFEAGIVVSLIEGVIINEGKIDNYSGTYM